ncbi:hypothetical protein K0B04_03855 [Patescibacteria group bacterium]|nr:hypothetical protein [Patescibacteria group bacterium]
MDINGKWEDFPIQWDEKTFFFRHDANNYALQKSKECLSENTQIKKNKIFTKEEWVIHKICVVISWALIISFSLVTIIALIFTSI